MRLLKIVGGVLALGVLAVVTLAAMKPDDFWIERNITMKAPAEKIFPLLNSPKAAMAWIPFMEPDPNVKIAYEGPESGVGAAQTWDGNNDVGKGRIEITESTPSSQVTAKLDFERPMEGHNTVTLYRSNPMATAPRCRG